MFKKIKSQEQASQQLKDCKNFADLHKFMARYNQFIKQSSKQDLAQDKDTQDTTQQILSHIYKQSKTHSDALKFLGNYTELMIQTIDKDAFLSEDVASEVVNLNTLFFSQAKEFSTAQAYLHYTSLIIDLAADAQLKVDISPCHKMASTGRSLLHKSKTYPQLINTSRSLNNLAVSVANAGDVLKDLDLSSNLALLQVLNTNAPSKHQEDLAREIVRTKQIKETYDRLLQPKPAKAPKPKQPPKMKKLKR